VLKSLPVLPLLLICAVRAGIAASDYTGIVTFAGLPVPGATVTATQAGVTRVTSTDVAGAYRFADLPEGAWMVRVDMFGFAPITQEVSVSSNAAASTWMLTLRAFEEYGRELPRASVFAPAVTTLALTTSTTPLPRGTTPPAAGTAVARTADANARPAVPPVDAPPPSDGGPFGAADGLLINGSVNNGAASPFAQLAAFGNNRRGARSLYNGGLGVLFGNSSFDARPFSFASREVPKPSYNDVQVAANFSGPVRTRWFRNGPTLAVSYQRAVDHNATTQSALVPSLLERSGDFSQSRDASGRPVRIVDPATGLPFFGNKIPAGRLSPQAQSLLKYYPTPNVSSDDRYNYETSTLTASQRDSVQLRASQAINGRNQLFGSVSYQRATTDATNLFAFTDATRIGTLTAAINWSHRSSPFASWRLTYDFSRTSTNLTPYFANRTNVSGEAGIGGNNQDAVNWGPPALTFSSGVAGLAGGIYALNHASAHGVAAETQRVIGRHNLTSGGAFRPQHVRVFSQQDARGTFGFTGLATGSGVADFLLGTPTTSAIAFGNPDKDLRATYVDAYINDDWRASPTLTVNGGVRWEFESPFTEAQSRLVNLDVARGFAAASPVLAGNPTGALTGRDYPESLIDADWRGFQPRVGIAWRPVAGSSLVVRGGYGIYRNTNVYQTLALLLAQQPPFSKTFSVTTSAANPLTMTSGFNVSGQTSNTFAIDPDFRVGYAHNWQASAQRDLRASLTITGTYFGTKGSHLLQEFLPNTYPAGAANPCLSCPSGFVYLTSGGSSTRHAGQVQLRRRLRSGLTATAQYTLARAMDNAAAFVVTASGVQASNAVGVAGAYIAQDWTDLDAERSPSNFDQRHQLTTQVEYTTGMGIAGGALMQGKLGALFRGWTITSQLNVGSGLPVTPVYVTPVAGTGVTGTVRAELTGASTDAVPVGYYANPAAYTAPGPGRWGNAGRNSIAGPSQFALNGALGRSFLLRNRLTLDCRLDATNLLNHVTYSGINAIVGSPQFGLPDRTNTMRRTQLSARLRF
jgi:hypothetical protein